ncbi:MAG: hypothetical protein QW199_00815 [Candidatus Pacearchaeota archaeon]
MGGKLEDKIDVEKIEEIEIEIVENEEDFSATKQKAKAQIFEIKDENKITNLYLIDGLKFAIITSYKSNHLYEILNHRQSLIKRDAIKFNDDYVEIGEKKYRINRIEEVLFYING